MTRAHLLALVQRDAAMPENRPEDDVPDLAEAPRRSVFVASTAGEDRMDDIVDQSSWQLDSYRANPVILWAHRSDLQPIGRAAVDVVDGRLLCSIEWDEAHPLGADCARQVREGYLSAVSVGFTSHAPIARRSLPAEDPRYKDGYGVIYTQNELLEISLVPIPANAGATVLVRGLGDPSQAEVIRCVRAGLPAPGSLGQIVDVAIAEAKRAIPVGPSADDVARAVAAEVVRSLSGDAAFLDAVAARREIEAPEPAPGDEPWWPTKSADWWDGST